MRSVFLLFSILIFSCSPNEKKESGYIEHRDSKQIVDAKFETLGGEEFDLSKYRGKVVFLNLWATWCKPCIYEMPSISRAADQLIDKDIIFLAASDEGLERIKKYQSKYPQYNFEFVRIKESVMDYGVQALPTTYILDKNGEIFQKEIGGREWDNPNQINTLSNL